MSISRIQFHSSLISFLKYTSFSCLSGCPSDFLLSCFFSCFHYFYFAYQAMKEKAHHDIFPFTCSQYLHVSYGAARHRGSLIPRVAEQQHRRTHDITLYSLSLQLPRWELERNLIDGEGVMAAGKDVTYLGMYMKITMYVGCV